MLRADVARDLDASSADFLGLVAPVLVDMVGGGRITPVEKPGPGAPRALSILDEQAGVDYLLESPDDSVYGIAARVQWIALGRAPFDTFTVRKERYSGARTEFEKRCAALDNFHKEPIFPRWTVQAYARRSPRALLSVGAMLTKQLYAHIRTGQEGVEWWRDRTDGASFIAVSWASLPAHYPVLIWRAP